MQHVGGYCQRVGGGVVEHRVSAAPSCLRDVRREVVEPVCQVGVGEQPGPARAEAGATLQHDQQLIGDPSTIVVQVLGERLSGPELQANLSFKYADDMASVARPKRKPSGLAENPRAPCKERGWRPLDNVD